MKPRAVAIVQARMASTRLPGKVLRDIEGIPMLLRVVGRAAKARQLDQVVVATSDQPQDLPISELCREQGIQCIRGHESDVLDRYLKAAEASQAGVVARITADCPLIDPQLIDEAVQVFLQASPPYDFVANRLPYDRSFPIGTDVEVCSLDGLRTAWQEASAPHQREHVMPYFYDQPERFRVHLLRSGEELGHLRWTVDTEEDLEFVRGVFRHFAPRQHFSWREVLALIAEQPELAAINAHIQAKPYLRSE